MSEPSQPYEFSEANLAIFDLVAGHWWRQPDGSLKSGFDLGRDCPFAHMKVCDPLPQGN